MSFQSFATSAAISGCLESSRKLSISSAPAYKSSFLTSSPASFAQDQRTSRIDQTSLQSAVSDGSCTSSADVLAAAPAPVPASDAPAVCDLAATATSCPAPAA